MEVRDPNLTRKLSAALVFIVLVLLVGHELKLYLPDLEVWVEGMGAFAPMGYILLFVALSPVFVSIDALCFAAGVLFPLVTGELTVIAATYLSAALIFFLGRGLFRARVLNFIAGHKRFTIVDAISKSNEAFKLMFLLRLTPLPFAMFSYALSVTQVKFWPYLVATSGILIYNGSLVYLGYTTKHLTGLIGEAAHKSVISHSVLVFGLLILLVVLVYVAKLAGNALKELKLENTDFKGNSL
jgi:uncharacterized membrane protein YdjX (TVP38/TMEM64 family)